MTFGERITSIRKRKGISQAELGKQVGTSGDIIGKYERNEVKPSIEVASNIADVLEISVDYLLGKTSMEIDKTTLKRLEDIAGLPTEKQSELFNVIDAYIRDFKTKQAYK
jgi:transcriptional regulator with XRE-family HTH domain